MEKIKLTPLQTIQVWNLIRVLKKNYPGTDFAAWADLLMNYLKPEVEYWNSLSEAYRISIMHEILEFPVVKIQAEWLPEVITGIDAKILDPVVVGDIRIYESQISMKLQSQSKIEKNGKSENTSAKQKAEKSK